MSTATTRTRAAKTRSEATERGAAETDKASLQVMLDRQIAEALWVPSDLSPDEILERMKTAVAAVESLKPQGILEQMLAVQIVATHNAALDCFRRAALPGQSPHVWEMSLRQGGKLMAACLRHMESFARLRDKDTAGVMLGNILNVQPGGQAVVQMQAELPAERGDAHAGRSTLALGHQPVETLDLACPSAPVVSDERIRRSPVPLSQDAQIRRSPMSSDQRSARRV